jgi:hypothetical protein
VASIGSWQDGAIWNGRLFVLNGAGNGSVVDVKTGGKLAAFTLDGCDVLKPHANSVCFGSTFFAPGDKYPLLYVNVYNNYASSEDRKEGTCCVYRILEKDGVFTTELVQVIRIGFVKETLWKSAGDKPDVRPYGNFVIDTEKNLLHVFTMRDAEHVTRYFTFRLPRLAEGECSPRFGVPTVTLGEEDILSRFDTDYHLFIQGACCHGGRIYSSEGFNADIHPSLRVIDPAAGVQLCHVDLTDLGYDCEAEWIDFRNGICYYSDAHGALYTIDFS